MSLRRPQVIQTMPIVRRLAVLFVAVSGCSRGPARFEAPAVDPVAAGARAIELYDANGDGKLDKEELRQAPAILAKLPAWDVDGNESVDSQEVEKHVAALYKSGTGGTKLNCLILYKGKPLSGATVTLEPEGFLGEAVQAATGVTDGSGATQLGIPPEYAPEHLRRIKTVHYGVFKVRVTHPTISIPEKYNVKTELGYETEPGVPIVRYSLN